MSAYRHEIARATTSRGLVAARRFAPLWAPALIGCVALAICWFRLPAEARATLWAEDGRIFVSERERYGSFDTLFRPYAGYLQFVPRLIADAVVGSTPVARWAIGFTALSCVVIAAVCAITYVCAGAIVQRTSSRIALAMIPVLVPIAPIEVSGNAANVHAYFLWLTPWLLFARPQRWWAAIALGVVALTGALTEIQALLFVPLVFWRWRGRKGWAIRLGLMIGLAAQVIVTILSPRPPGRAVSYHLWSVVEGFAANAMMGAVTAQSHIVALAFTTTRAILVLVSLVFCASVVVSLIRGNWRSRTVVLTCVVAAAAIWAAGYLANPFPGFDFATYGQPAWSTFGFMRYGVVPAMFLLATIPLASDALMSRFCRASALVVGVIVAIAVISQWNVPTTQRSAGPVWSTGVSHALSSCRASDQMFVNVPVAPAGWSAQIRCTSGNEPRK